MPACTAKEEEQSSVGNDAQAASENGPELPVSDNTDREAVPNGTTAVSLSPWGLRGQGRPPLSPVRQSVQDLALSRESSPGKMVLPSSSSDAVTGMLKQDMNVHCNPLFTEPLTAHQTGAAQKLGTGGGHHGSPRSQQGSEAASLGRSEGIGQQRDVPGSPPSELQQSLRALLQQHSRQMEVSIASIHPELQ